MSNQLSASGAACSESLSGALTHLLTHSASDVSEDAPLLALWHYFFLFRSTLVKALTAGGSLSLTPKQLSALWESKVERKLTQALGEGVGTTAPNKKAGGALHDALMAEIEAGCKRRKSSCISSVADVLDALASQRLVEWHTSLLSHGMGVNWYNVKYCAERVRHKQTKRSSLAAFIGLTPHSPFVPFALFLSFRLVFSPICFSPSSVSGLHFTVAISLVAARPRLRAATLRPIFAS